MRTLERLTIRNFKSIRDQQLELGRLNVFIGGNGSGKSNLIGVFHFLRRVAAGQLQTHTGVAGGAGRILHFGRKRSESLAVGLLFGEGHDVNGYEIELVPTTEDRFAFEHETVTYHRRRYGRPYEERLAAGHAEAKLVESKDGIAGYVRQYLQDYRIYHFHDTSSEAKVKQTARIDDNKVLHADASNLAPVLYRLKKREPDRFRMIEATIQQIAPFFDSFDLDPDRLNPDVIRLEWRERGSDTVFNAHALSDGTLRFVCLTTLFLQPSPKSVS